MAELSARDVAAWRADPAREPPVLVDVREPWERDICAIAGSLALPMGELAARLDQLPQDRELVLVCHAGQRSAMVTRWLAARGYQAHNLAGGVDAWALTVEPSMRRY
jgi:rhodanese-related sulfurtransferase